MEPALRRLVDEHDIRKLVIAFSNGMDAREKYNARPASETTTFTTLGS